MLLCKQTRCLWYLAYINRLKELIVRVPAPNQRMSMSKIATVGIRPTATLFGRFLATVDRVLMTNATIAARNGDLPYFGL